MGRVLMPSGLGRYDPSTECVKCGGDEHRLRYRPRYDNPFFTYEHLESHCNTCGYTWKSLTEDAEDGY